MGVITGPRKQVIVGTGMSLSVAEIGRVEDD